MTFTTEPAVLVLEDGTRYAARLRRARPHPRRGGLRDRHDRLPGDPDRPVLRRADRLQTAPHIGNTGMNDEDPESRRIWVSGYIVRDPCRVVSNYRADGSLDDALVERRHRRHQRHRHARRHASTSAMPAPCAAESSPGRMPHSSPTSSSSSCGARPRWPAATSPPRSPTTDGVRHRLLPVSPIGNLAVLDLGVKTSTLNYLAARGFDVHVLPQIVTLDELLAIDPVAVFYSNGPGDPGASDAHVELLRGVLRRRLPFFGICFGNQLLGRALGFGTYKLPFGHRGINQPVLDIATGRVEITRHNHGFAVDAPRGNLRRARPASAASR